MGLEIINDEIDFTNSDTINSGLSKLASKYAIIKENMAVVTALRVIALDRNPSQEAMLATPKYAIEYKKFVAATRNFRSDYQNLKQLLLDKGEYSPAHEKLLQSRLQSQIADY